MTTTLHKRFPAVFAGLSLILILLTSPLTASAGVNHTLTLTKAPRAGGEITITGKGFDTTGPGVYVAIAPSTVTEFYGNSQHFYGHTAGGSTEDKSTVWVYTPQYAAAGAGFEQGAPMDNQGNFEIKMPSPKFEDGKEWVVLTTKAHGQGKTHTEDNSREPLVYEPEPVLDPDQPTMVDGCPSPKTTHKLETEMFRDVGIRWSIGEMFFKYAKDKGYTMHVQHGYPLANETVLNGPVDVSTTTNTLTIQYKSVIEFKKDGKSLYTIGKPRLVFNDHRNVELYLTLKDGVNPEKEVHFGTILGPFYISDDDYGFYEVIRTENSPVKLDPNAAAALPGLSVETDVPKFTFKFRMMDRSNMANPVETYKSMWNLQKGCGKFVWMNLYGYNTAATAPPAPVTPPPPAPTVDEENAQWNEADAAETHNGELRWGIKKSWRSYVGLGEMTEGLTYSDGSYLFHSGHLIHQGEDGSKVFQYAGRVHFEAYGGILWLTFSDPQVRIDKDGKAVLWLKQWVKENGQDVDKGYVEAVSIDGPITEQDNVVSTQNSPTYLKQQLRDIFIYAYRTGLRMSNLSFSAQMPTLKVVDKGADVTSMSVDEVTQDSDYTVHLAGFKANQDLQLVLHSSPTHLADVTADANGVVTATIHIPSNAAVGLHSVVAKPRNDDSNWLASVHIRVVEAKKPDTGGNVTGNTSINPDKTGDKKTAAQKNLTPSSSLKSANKVTLAKTGLSSSHTLLLSLLVVILGVGLRLRRENV